MKRTILGMTEAGEPLILEALEALRLYREAKTLGRPQEEIDQLKILADSLVLNRPGFSRHLASSLRNAFQTLPVTADC